MCVSKHVCQTVLFAFACVSDRCSNKFVKHCIASSMDSSAINGRLGFRFLISVYKGLKKHSRKAVEHFLAMCKSDGGSLMAE